MFECLLYYFGNISIPQTPHLKNRLKNSTYYVLKFKKKLPPVTIVELYELKYRGYSR